MTRTRADDYEEKASSILDAAAKLFAKTGFPSAKMEDIAKACGTSKSMIYHYFKTKDDILFEMLREHLTKIEEAISLIDADVTNNDYILNSFVQIYVQKSTQSRRRNVIAMNDVRFLPKVQQTKLIEIERRIVVLTTTFIKRLNPNLESHLYSPYAMMFLGVLNWNDTWYNPNGAIRPQELCDRIARLFLHGFAAEK